eukprot:Gregarina_sp_Pseudo_9__928@NODE_1595_length_1470_cov_6_821104_g1479_i0_p1_GENE_NODE_1595_length_1470_cov_6_821104_g1479_i0NODE_1595_length_1470_cov_6_821104_g1479_i0_p1_ORF_typecomplete_len317_score74_76Bud13/PF09736_9/1_9e03Bud13/PF09736_9/2_7e31_NODE_1595_length_1470_cov_6_821104_g1479_i04241374
MRNAAERRQFEKRLLEKYAAPASKSTPAETRANLRIYDEDSALAETAQPRAEVAEHVEENELVEDEDAAFIREAMQEELKRQNLPVVAAPSQKSAAPSLKRRRNSSDFSSDDEIQRRNQPRAGDGEKSAGRRRNSDFPEADELRRITKKGDGVSTETITYRDRYGRRITEKEWKESVAGRRKPQQPERKPKVEKIPEKDLAWGGGLVQKRLEEERKKYEAEVANEPFARYEVTESYDKEMKEKELWEDPMRKMQEGNDSKSKSDERPKCKFPAPPNRYHISPGSHWDGRVRGTNFEERYLNAINAARKEAYSYTAD